MKLWIKTLVTLTLLGVVSYLVPWNSLWVRARGLDPRVWIVVLTGLVVAHLAGTFKWRMNVNVGRAGLQPADAIQCYWAGLFANLYLPGIAGGDWVRAILAGRITKRFEAVFFGSLVDRVIDVAALLLLSMAGAFLSHAVLPRWAKGSIWAVFAIVACGAVVVWIALSKVAVGRWPRRFQRSIKRWKVAARRLSTRPRTAAAVLCMSLAIQSTFVLMMASFGSAVGIHVPLQMWFFAWPATKIVTMLPISLGGLGVREATLAALLSIASVPTDQGVLVSLLWQALTMFAGLAGGFVWFAMGLRARAQTGAGHGSMLAAVKSAESEHA